LLGQSWYRADKHKKELKTKHLKVRLRGREFKDASEVDWKDRPDECLALWICNYN
jgi:hypothetical protein